MKKSEKDQYQQKLIALQKATSTTLTALNALPEYRKEENGDAQIRSAFLTIYKFEEGLVKKYKESFEWLLKDYNYNRKNYFVKTPIKE